MSGQALEQLTLSQEGSPASRFPWLESKKVKGMTVTSGRKCSELCENLSRLTLSVRMYLESCELPGKQFAKDLEREGYAVTVFNYEAAAVGAWHRRERVFFVAYARQQPERTEGNGPRYQQQNGIAEGVRAAQGHGLADLCKAFPGTYNTETARQREHGREIYAESESIRPCSGSTYVADTESQQLQESFCADRTRITGFANSSEDVSYTDNARLEITGLKPRFERFMQKTELNSAVGGQLNPDWVCWLMGFPTGWANISE